MSTGAAASSSSSSRPQTDADSSSAEAPPPSYAELQWASSQELRSPNGNGSNSEPQSTLTISWNARNNTLFPPLPPSIDPDLSTAASPREADADSSASPQPAAPPPNMSHIPLATEFSEATVAFEKSFEKLREYARGIFQVTKELSDTRQTMYRIHEQWMDLGMHAIAHDVLPILDKANRYVPKYAFPPGLEQSLASSAS